MTTPHESRTILLLEDEAALRNVLIEVLEEAGYSVLVAATAAEALSAARTSAGAIDAIVADVGIPGKSGSEVAEAIKTLNPRAAIVYISGNIDAPLGQEAARRTGARFLHKPFRTEELLREVERATSGAAPPE
jgi:CheY-like chemotaxis protein